MVFEGTLNSVGNTPLQRLKELEEAFGLGFEVYAKVELHNPSGSIKDRAAKAIVDNAFKRGELKDGFEIVEATSGNMGISLAMIASLSKLGCRIYMPSSASRERSAMMKAFGANVILVDGGMKECSSQAKEYCKTHAKTFYSDQFNNYDSVLAHKRTGAEIMLGLASEDSKRTLPDYFIAGIGTGGTITGCALAFKEEAQESGLPKPTIIGVEPAASPLLTKGFSSAHKIQGIGANFVPAILDRGLVDEVVDIENEEAYQWTRYLAKFLGLFVGITSGAALAGLMKKKDAIKAGAKVVIVLPDSGQRYLSVEGLYD